MNLVEGPCVSFGSQRKPNKKRKKEDDAARAHSGLSTCKHNGPAELPRKYVYVYRLNVLSANDRNDPLDKAKRIPGTRADLREKKANTIVTKRKGLRSVIHDISRQREAKVEEDARSR